VANSVGPVESASIARLYLVGSGIFASVLGSFRLLAQDSPVQTRLDENSSSLCSIVQFFNSPLGSFRISRPGPEARPEIIILVQYCAVF
jgi:hypothetical protein